MVTANDPENLPESSCTPRSSSAPLTRASRDLLKAAAEDTIRLWEPAPEETPDDHVGTSLSKILQAIQNAIEADDVPRLEIAPWVPAGRLLESFRRCFLTRALTSPAAAEVLRVLAALELIQQHVEQDISQRFRGRLSGPDALELLAGVAHDMRSPLASILMLVESMRLGNKRIPATLKRHLGLVYGAAFGLSTLAENLFDLARGLHLAIDQQRIPFSVEQTMQTVRDIVLPIAEEKGLAIEVQRLCIDRRIGAPQALQRVLLNLAANSLKYTTQGFVQLSAIDVSRIRVLFEVRDTGPGMDPDKVKTVCSAFQHIRSTGKLVFSTPGLGLSLCQKIVRSMGGELGIDSIMGQGTRFFFELDLPMVENGSDQRHSAA